MITSSARRRDAVGSVPRLRRQSYCLCLPSIDSKSQESEREMCASKSFRFVGYWNHTSDFWLLCPFPECSIFQEQSIPSHTASPATSHFLHQISHTPFKILPSHLLQTSLRIVTFLPSETLVISHRYFSHKKSYFTTSAKAVRQNLNILQNYI